MVKINEDLLIGDLAYTIGEMQRSSQNNFVKNNYNDLLILDESLAYNFGKVFPLDNVFFNPTRVQEILDKKRQKELFKYIAYINRSEDTIKKIIKTYKEILDNLDFQRFYVWKKMRRYSEKDFIDVILSYFKTYGDKYYNIAKKYFDEGRIQTGCASAPDADWDGFFSRLLWLDSGYVFSAIEKYSSSGASAISHELGHAIDAETFIFPQQKVITTMFDPLLEVPSTTFEVGFIDFLKKHHIDFVGSRAMMNDRMALVYDFVNDLDEAFDHDEDLFIYPDGFATCNSIIDPETKEPKVYDFRDELVYTLGYYFGWHLNYIKENYGEEEFYRAFNDIITTRKEATLEQSIEMLGMSVEDFTSGKFIRSKLEGEYMELKRRYNF